MARSARGDDISGGILDGGKDSTVSGRRSVAACELYMSDLPSECRVEKQDRRRSAFPLFNSAIFGRPPRQLLTLYFWATKHPFQLFGCLSVLLPSSGEVSLQTRSAAQRTSTTLALGSPRLTQLVLKP